MTVVRFILPSHRFKVIARGSYLCASFRSVFALVLLSMFFFYVEGRGWAFRARCKFAAVMSRTFLRFAHGPPFTQERRFVAAAAALHAHRGIHPA